MLGDKVATATIAVRDLGVAKRFYEDRLGLKIVKAEGSEAILYECGASRLLVYKSEFAGTNKATAVTWVVGDDIEGAVSALKERRVSFEHYEFPGTTLVGDVHVMGDMKIAWFKDPDGNIHALVRR